MFLITSSSLAVLLMSKRHLYLRRMQDSNLHIPKEWRFSRPLLYQLRQSSIITLARYLLLNRGLSLIFISAFVDGLDRFHTNVIAQKVGLELTLPLTEQCATITLHFADTSNITSYIDSYRVLWYTCLRC